MSLFEESTHVPLIIAGPGVKAVGKSSPRNVELIDVYPTLAALCGFEAPRHLQGQSLKPLLDDPTGSWSKPALTEVRRGPSPNAQAKAKAVAKKKKNQGAGFNGYSLRTDRYRYTEWDSGHRGRQLYDHRADPDELHNLADDPKMAEVVERMHQEMSHMIAPSR
jgi:uncharacterized sulfatase